MTLCPSPKSDPRVFEEVQYSYFTRLNESVVVPGNSYCNNYSYTSVLLIFHRRSVITKLLVLSSSLERALVHVRMFSLFFMVEELN